MPSRTANAQGRSRLIKLIGSVFIAACMLSVLCVGPGCASWQYHVGSASLFRPDIRTVHVPVFRSSTYRRGLGERLTEAVIKQIERVTPYKVVGADSADSTLVGSLSRTTKNVLAENANDMPRNLEVALFVRVQWTGRAGEPLMHSSTPAGVYLSDNATFIPEGGQSISTAQQKAIDRLAAQIVASMELGL